MKFQIDWQPQGPNVAPEEGATIADLRIYIGGGNACANERPRRSGKGATANRNVRRSECATVSVYPLAAEIAFNWWHLFGARDAKLQLADGRDGYAVPDVQLAFDGLEFNACCQPLAYDNPDVRFTHRGTERLTKAEAESALTEFVECVRDRLADANVGDSGLQLRWERVQRSRESVDESAFCEAAGALGLDPYGIDDAVADSIENAGAWFHGEPLLELLSGLCRVVNRSRASTKHVLAWLREAESRSADRTLLPAIDDLRDGMADMRHAAAGEMSWCVGYRCAREARRRLNIGTAERFSVSTLAARLGGPGFAIAEGSVAGLRAVVAKPAETHVHLCKAGSRYAPSTELFALGRAVGDAVTNPLAERSAVNDLHEAVRQAASRAFGAEFLAPIDGIRSMQDDGMSHSEIAADFCVSKEVVERQLQNQQRIAEACAAR